MNKSQLLILGNGSDLHCGLKSSYKDFFCSEILDIYRKNCGYPMMKEDCKGFWEELLFCYYDADDSNAYQWCDIETIIKNSIELIFYGKQAEKFNLQNGLWNTALNFVNEKRKLRNDETYQQYEPIIKHIFCFCVKFFESIKFNNYSTQEKLHLLSNQLLQELKNLEKRFCKYLKNQIVNLDKKNEINEKYIINAANLIARLTGFSNGGYENIEDIVEQNEEEYMKQITPAMRQSARRIVNTLSEEFSKLRFTHILSFNYTALFDILNVESPCKYSNVHGKLCLAKCEKDCKSSNIIFGIDDNIIQSQDASSELRLFSKTYRKMLFAGEPINILPPKEAKPLEIKFYGHSLSEADYSYFQSIFDYYDLYGNSNVSLKFYYSKGYEQHDTIYKLISSYGHSLNNKEQGKNLIHKLLLENRLHIQEMKE